MHVKRLKYLIVYILLCAMLFSCLPVSADEAPESVADRLLQLRELYDAAHAETESLRAGGGVSATLKASIDAENSLTLRELHLLEELKAEYNGLTEAAAARLGSARRNAEKCLSGYRARLRVLEERGAMRYLGLILGAESITELLRSIVDIGDIIRSDSRLRDRYLDALSELRAAKNEYERAETALLECMSEHTILSGRLRAGLKDSSSVIAELGKLAKADPKAASTLNGMSAAAESRLREAMNSLMRRDEPEPTDDGSEKELFWPVESVYITSLPGGRVHPVTGSEGNHDGADVGIDYGSPVYAADAGRVGLSCDGWNGGYGSYIVISHDGGIETLYAHLSIRTVSETEEVTKGQLIGYTGDSGRATGPHLHYELWEKGARADPLSFYPEKRFQYSPTA